MVKRAGIEGSGYLSWQRQGHFFSWLSISGFIDLVDLSANLYDVKKEISNVEYVHHRNPPPMGIEARGLYFYPPLGGGGYAKWRQEHKYTIAHENASCKGGIFHINFLKKRASIVYSDTDRMYPITRTQNRESKTALQTLFSLAKPLWILYAFIQCRSGSTLQSLILQWKIDYAQEILRIVFVINCI